MSWMMERLVRMVFGSENKEEQHNNEWIWNLLLFIIKRLLLFTSTI